MSKHRPILDGQIHTVETGWTDTLLICRKCSKKLNGGFGEGGKETLRRALRTALRAAGRRGQVGIMEVGCLGICPKRAVTTARSAEPGQFRIIPAGAPASALLAP